MKILNSFFRLSLISVVFTSAFVLNGAQARCAEPRNTENRSKIIETLTRQSDAWDKAIVQKDRPAIESNMAEDFRQIDGSGNIETKESFVKGVISPDLEIDPYTVEEFDVRLYGDVALLSGRTKMTGRFQGKPFTSHYRYIDIYVRQGEQWKIVSVQVSRIPEKDLSE